MKNIFLGIRSGLVILILILVSISWMILIFLISLHYLKSNEPNIYTTSGYRVYDGDSSNLHPPFSNFGDSNQYECTGYCYCYETERRTVSSEKSMISPLIYIVVTALTSVVASKIAKMHFQEECEKSFSIIEEEHDYCDVVISEVDDCEPLFSTFEEIREIEQKPIYDYDETTPFFVYGTLRPDADRRVQWCEWWNESNELRSRKGYVKNCDLYMSDYPFIVLNGESSSSSSSSSSWKDHICFGYVQDFYPRLELEEYNTALEILDDVEGYPRLYLRKLVDVHLISQSEEFNKELITGDEETVSAHAYYMEEIIFSNFARIRSGDFLNVWGD